MNKRLAHLLQTSLLVVVAMTSLSVQAAKPAAEYFPAGTSFDPSVPTPSSVLGSYVGEWHVRHDQLVDYMYAVAEASPRVSIIETGRSHGNRPLLQLRFTSEQNQARLDDIRQQHMATLTSGAKPSSDAPLIVYMGYSVHGNESSAANAALLIAYYLAAAETPEVSKLLNENLVLLDPVLNPDGHARFAQWANMHRGTTLNSDRDHREHREDWPSGRTNYYWFDLNRDWLLLTHPESRARVAQYQGWRPHILTDFHEMGSDSTYFFQPGIPSRKHPMTPQSNVTLTEALAEFHAAALDKQKTLYFSEEAFDDFYYGKGSTYPDAHGSIGILFEQASSRGHLHETINGDLSFAETIQNQVVTSLSTFAGALANKQAILAYQAQFFADTQELREQDKVRGFVIAASFDHVRVKAMTSILEQHKIDYAYLSQSTEVDETRYPAGSIFVSLDQAQYRLLKSLFSEQTSFADNTFYDVSSWNLPLAFDLAYSPVDRSQQRKLKLTQTPVVAEMPALDPEAYAYAFDWHHYNAPALLTQLLNRNVQARISGATFTAETGDSEREFAAGAVVLPVGLAQPQQWVENIEALAKQYQIPVFSITSGLTSQGIDLGSRQLRPVKKPAIALIGGRGTSQYEVGEIWHYLDTRMHAPASIVEQWRLNNTDLDQYTHIVFANGNYTQIEESTQKRITDWIRKGGVVIGQKQGAAFLMENKWLNAEQMSTNEVDKLFSTDDLNYADREALNARKLIAGTVFTTDVDLSHPLAFGLDDDMLPMFKTNNRVIRMPDIPFVAPFTYQEAPLKSGYADPKLAELIAETPAAVAHRLGNGRVIGFADNLNFRGYWYGTSKVFANAVYMSGLVDAW